VVIEQDKTYWPALTGVRAVAAFMVFIHHYNPFTPQICGLYMSNFFKELHIGVTLFFVLSGFLIANRYYFQKDFHFRNYMINRIARIYPVYFILTSLAFIGFAIFKGENSINKVFVYISNITFIRGYFENYKFSGLAQGWSLTVEETFYCLAPLFFYTIRRTKLALIIWPIICFIIGLCLVYVFKSIAFYGFMKSNTFMLLYTFLGRCFEFFFGIALALFLNKINNGAKTKYFTYIGFLMILLCVLAISLLGSADSSGLLHPIGILTNNIILPIFGICLFYYGLIREQTVISKALSSKYAIMLGKSSYIFYLIHITCVDLYLVLVNRTDLNFFHYAIVFIAINLISICMFKYLEEPLHRYIRNKYLKAF
jgi:peptidoglycan/LPS O-acetylase OafA/YrhL